MRRLHTALQARPYLATPCALLSLLIIVALVIPALLLKLLLVIFSCLLYPLLSACFPIIVEHLYMWPCVGRLHVWIMGLGRRGKPDKIFHSRFLDLRVEVLTEVPGKARTVAAPARRYVHLLPQFQNNYSYLVVDAVEVVHPQAAGTHKQRGSNSQPTASISGGQVAEDREDAQAVPEVSTFYFGVLVDPADELALESALALIDSVYYNNRLRLEMVLTTHKHWDHQSGNAWLARKFPHLTFYSGEDDVLRRAGARAGMLLVDGDCLELRYSLPPKDNAAAVTSQLPSRKTKMSEDEVEAVLQSSTLPVNQARILRVEHVITRQSNLRAPSTSPPQQRSHPSAPDIPVNPPDAVPALVPPPPLVFRVLATPCHTRGHVVFLLLEAWEGEASPACDEPASTRQPQTCASISPRTNSGARASTRFSTPCATGSRQAQHCLFAGDVLFSGGQGAHFEGRQIEMLQNLHTVLAWASPNTLIFPGHEYTHMLLAKQLNDIDPSMPPTHFLRIAAAAWRAVHRRAMHERKERVPTVPVHLEEELLLNPALRQVVKSTGCCFGNVC
jgi:glyoxylase-like metal-dependent hydrolase (beta-lactamase superfamily II)